MNGKVVVLAITRTPGELKRKENGRITTKNFLDDLGLKGLDQLPPLEDVGELIDDLGKDLEAPRITNPKKTTDGSGEEKNIE